jgi:predicted membrane protein
MNDRFLWWQTLGILVIVVGVLLLLAVLGVLGSPTQALGIIFGAILIGLGLYVLVRFRPGAGPAKNALAGSIRHTGPNWTLGNERYQIGMGEIRLDLTRAHIPEGEHKLELECFVGSIRVTVPRIVGVSARGHCTLGKVSIMGEKEDGFARTVMVRSRDYAGASRKIEIDADVMLGEVKIEFGVWDSE